MSTSAFSTRLLTLLVACTTLAACSSEPPDTTGQPTAEPSGTPTAATTGTPSPTATATPTSTGCNDDLDADGYIDDACPDGRDCNDLDATIHPNAAEGVDSDDDGKLEGDDKDNNCNDIVDEGTIDYDDDGDGYSEVDGDCNDLASAINPGAKEACDEIDNDCDDIVDDVDLDGDGYIDEQCGGDDCADLRDDIHPDAAEGTDTDGDGIPDADFEDNDCDGVIDETTSSYDDDGDGLTESQGDCDDTDPVIYPGAVERFDDKDQNCDDDLTWGNTAAAAPASADGYISQARTGHSMAGVGDVDGDGVGDLLIGAPFHDAQGEGRGAAFLVSGAVSGWNVNMPLAESVLFTIPTVDAKGARIGWAVAGTGDLSGDGLPDMAIGAPGYSHNNDTNAGAVHILAGGVTPFEDTVLGTQMASGGSVSYGLSANVELGYSLDGAHWDLDCDVTGDRINDLLIGGPFNQSTPGIGARGYLMLFPGSLSGLPTELKVKDLASFQGQTEEALGYSVACAGDTDGVLGLNGNPTSEILIAGKGDTTQMGRAYWLPGDEDFQSAGPRLSLPEDAVAFSGDAPNEWVGHSLSGLGDVNQDGLHDFAIGRGARTANQALAYVLYGGVTPAGGSLEGGQTVRILGEADDTCPCVAEGVGDFNRDGIDDMVVTASLAPGAAEEAQAGKIFIFLGKPAGWADAGTSIDTSTADYVFYGEAAGDQFGTSVARAGDLNGDGYEDFVVSAPYASVDGDEGPIAQAGRVYVFFGFADPLN